MRSCSVRYRLASSHFRRCWFSSEAASSPAVAEGVREDWRREPEGREAALEERRWPALAWVLTIVSSFSEMSFSLIGDVGGDFW